MRMGLQARYTGARPTDMKPGEIGTGGHEMSPSQPGGAMSGVDMSKLRSMSPEERKRMVAQMKSTMPKEQ
jgi:hypothetical protein